MGLRGKLEPQAFSGYGTGPGKVGGFSHTVCR